MRLLICWILYVWVEFLENQCWCLIPFSTTKPLSADGGMTLPMLRLLQAMAQLAINRWSHSSGWIMATSNKLRQKGSVVSKAPLFQQNQRFSNRMIHPIKLLCRLSAFSASVAVFVRHVPWRDSISLSPVANSGKLLAMRKETQSIPDASLVSLSWMQQVPTDSMIWCMSSIKP